MKFTSAITSLVLTLSSLSAASPIVSRQAPDHFYLQTSILSGQTDTGTNKHGLYVFSYHTGAGQGAATASAALPNSHFYLNDTTLLWTYPDNQIGPWPVTIEYGAYQAFNEISISIAGGTPQEGYSVNGTGLQTNSAAGGWLACDWWYTDPSIFALTGYEQGPLPSSCSKVYLIAVPAA